MGTSDCPYTYEEFERMLNSGTWEGGYVQFHNSSEPIYTVPEVTSTGDISKKIGGTGNDSYDDLYLGGYQCGYDAALSDSKWDDLWAFIQSGMAAIANTSGDNDGLNWYNNGIKQGYLDGCKYKQK